MKGKYEEAKAEEKDFEEDITIPITPEQPGQAVVRILFLKE